MIWTAAGLYAVWRLVVRPLLRAGYLVLKAISLLVLAGLRLLAGVQLHVHDRDPVPLGDDTQPTGHPVPTTGDWRADRETLRRLLAEGKIR